MNITLLVLSILLIAVSLIVWIKDMGKDRELNTYRRVVKELSDRLDTMEATLRRIRSARMLYTRHPAYVEVRRQIETLTS